MGGGGVEYKVVVRAVSVPSGALAAPCVAHAPSIAKSPDNPTRIFPFRFYLYSLQTHANSIFELLPNLGTVLDTSITLKKNIFNSIYRSIVTLSVPKLRRGILERLTKGTLASLFHPERLWFSPPQLQRLMTAEELERLRVLQLQGGDADQLWVSPRQGRFSHASIDYRSLNRGHRAWPSCRCNICCIQGAYYDVIPASESTLNFYLLLALSLTM